MVDISINGRFAVVAVVALPGEICKLFKSPTVARLGIFLYIKPVTTVVVIQCESSQLL